MTPDSPTPIPLSYEVASGRRILSPRLVVGVWVGPALIQAIGWIVLFHDYVGDGLTVYSRNILASISGPMLFVAGMTNLLQPNSLPQYAGVALVSWLVLLPLVCLRWSRQLPLVAHVVLSIGWEGLGWLLYEVMCF